MKYLREIVIAISVAMIIVMTMSRTPAIDATFVRKNVVDLTPQEKLDFVHALKTLKT